MKAFLRSIVPLLGVALFFSIKGRMPAEEQPAATKEKPFVNTLGMKFVPVPIPGGKPVLFCIWKTRVRDFDLFVKTTGRDATQGMVSLLGMGRLGTHGNSWKNPGYVQTPELPVCGISFGDAEAFCEWLSKKEKKKYRLPTDHEWSCAVGIGEQEGARENPVDKNGRIKNVYPWGTQWPPTKGAGNYAGEECGGAPGIPSGFKGIEGYRDRYVFASPVGSFDANRFGLFDLGGNLWEWCDTDYDGTGKSKTLRGASWYVNLPAFMLSSCRIAAGPGERNFGNGFRCVLGE